MGLELRFDGWAPMSGWVTPCTAPGQIRSLRGSPEPGKISIGEMQFLYASKLDHERMIVPWEGHQRYALAVVLCLATDAPFPFALTSR
jgi:hypothetical protein